MAAIFVLGSHWLSARLIGVLAGSLPGWLENAEGEYVTDQGPVPAVQLPPNVFQNYGEAEEDDPYRYYEPSYPAPRPVAPNDPSLALEGMDLRSPGVHRSSRSVEGGRERDGPKRKQKRAAKTPPGLSKWEELIGGWRAAPCLWLGGVEKLRTNQQVPDVEDFFRTL